MSKRLGAGERNRRDVATDAGPGKLGPAFLSPCVDSGAVGSERRPRPWEQAHAAAARAGVAIRALDALDDADRVRRIIERVWGAQVMPRELLRAFQHAGSVLIGAEVDGEVVGFVFGFLGFSEGLHLHSHMLAVVPERQSGGIGYALKLAQRAMCLDEGIEEVRWTYDPLVGRNARFNLIKLGAAAMRFLPQHYGAMSDRLNVGDRSDRFEVRWRLSAERSDRALRGEAASPERGAALLVPDESRPDWPLETGAAPVPGAVVGIPPDHFDLRRRYPEAGLAWREASARSFAACFDAGLEATWFEDGAYVFAVRAGP
jgi:predicted GNAT superfamily acetyltransferase